MNKAIIALAAMAISGAAVAGPNWTYADVGYSRASSGAQDNEGYNLRGSIGFADKYHANVVYYDNESNGGKGSSGGSDDTGYDIGFGVHPAVSDTTDLVVEIGYFDGEQKMTGFKDVLDGFRLTTGLRAMWADNVEVNAAVDVLSGDAGQAGFSKSDFTEIGIRVGGQYTFTDNVGVGVDVSNGGMMSGNAANFYLRWNF